jgi:hypothetical protein
MMAKGQVAEMIRLGKLFFLNLTMDISSTFTHIFYFKLDLQSLLEYRSIECMAMLVTMGFPGSDVTRLQLTTRLVVTGTR